MPSAGGPGILALAAALAGAVVAWSLATLYTEQLRFAVYAPQVKVGVEAAAVVALLFGALVLSMFLTERSGERLLWVAGGLLVSGLGGVAFEYADVLMGNVLDPDTTTYQSLLVWTVAATLFATGLVPKKPPQLGRGLMLGILAAFALACVVLGGTAHLLPPLVSETNPATAVASGELPHQATGWNAAFASVPLLLAVASAWGAASLYRRGSLGGWLVLAMVLLAGSQLRGIFQPPAYSPVLTVADLLHLAFASVVAFGGVLKLRRIAAEREAFLAAERETSGRLGELSVMKADFTSMVAHELNSPLAAIRTLADVLAIDDLDPTARKQVLGKILSETDALSALITDVRTAGTIERDDFTVETRPVSLEMLLSDAVDFAKNVHGGHPVEVVVDDSLDEVLADPERIGQVLRNLLGNAAKFSPEGAPITLSATKAAWGRMRVEVADKGTGIHPDDLSRIFEKFGRGRDAEGRKVPGVGLGLYLSRRIVRCHGSDLTVRSAPGEGSVFAFELGTAR